MHHHSRPQAARSQPFMLKRLFCGQTLLWILFHQSLHKKDSITRYRTPPRSFHRILSLLDFLNLLSIWSKERHLPREQNVYNHTKAPHVALACIFFVLLEHLWGDVSERPAICFHLCACFPPCFTEAKVDQLEMAFISRDEHDVLQLQIAMDKLTSVHVVDRQQQLPSQMRSGAFVEPPNCFHAIEQLSTLEVLHCQLQAFVRFVNLVKVRNVWMV
mmetsp:Transcript_10270/g.16785  ORF Transcript_10270/g.16785 Transcript_10270/m.16785 type:complete len:216 (-) Transcript_10270:377-1024(-)